jgi:general secretion pathway protein N
VKDRIIRPGIWLAVLLFAVLVWAVVMLPARPVLAPLNGIQLGPAALQLSRIEGRLWQGNARWQWQALSGSLRWETSWRGLSFGADLTVSGDIVATGWVGAAPAGVSLAGVDIVVPVAPLVQGMPNVSAEGLATVRGLGLQWSDGAPHGAEAMLSYSGGRISWAPGQGAEIPVLTGNLRQDGGAAVLEVRSPDSALLADGQLTNESARLRVYRAWPALLGVSQGGSPTDVVFETSQQLAP